MYARASVARALDFVLLFLGAGGRRGFCARRPRVGRAQRLGRGLSLDHWSPVPQGRDRSAPPQGRRRLKRSASSLLAGVILLGCSGGASPVTLSSGALPEGQAVRAGSELVSGATLARIVQQQGVAPSAAASAALSDALLAQSARDSFPSSISRSIERAAVAGPCSNSSAKPLAAAAHLRRRSLKTSA